MRISEWIRNRRSSNRAGIVSPSKRSSSSGWVRIFSSLTTPNFRTLWSGMLFSMAAMQVNIVSRSWLAYNISGSGLALGVVTMAHGLPQIFLAPFGGVAADRFDKRKLLLITQSSMSILALVNAVLVHSGIIRIWHLVVIGLFQGVLSPFTMPTRQTYIAELVGQDQLANALALDSSGRNLNRVLIPSVAGVLIAWNPTVAFYTIPLLYLGSTLTIWQLPPSQSPTAPSSGIWSEITVGFRYIAEHSRLLTLWYQCYPARIDQDLLPRLNKLPYPPYQIDRLFHRGVNLFITGVFRGLYDRNLTFSHKI